MTKVIHIEQINREEWRQLVQTSTTGTWFQSPEAYDFFASLPELFVPFAYGIADFRLQIEDCELRGVCCGYVTVERNPLKQFFTRRAIILGGPCLADDATEEEAAVLMSAVVESVRCKEDNNKHYTLNIPPIYIETRNFNDYSRWRGAFAAAGFSYQPHLNFHIDTSSPETVEANLGKSRKRDIRTTIREGVKIEDLRFKIEDCKIEEFYRILDRLYKTKVRTPLFPLSFFLALSKHPDSRFLLTEYQGRIIGGTVCVEQAGKCLYEWFACGEDGIYPHIFPSCYATYAGIRYAAEHGCPRFDMMGAGKPGEAYGVRDFKAKFGGQEVEHGRYLYIAKPLLYQLGKLGVKLLKGIKH